MAALEASGPNAEQIRYWNEQAGPLWVELQSDLDLQLAGLGRLAVLRSKVSSGERVLDVGCGCGESSLELARAVGTRGRVLGIDISAPMLERARERAAAAGLAQAEFNNADAQTQRFAPASFDLLHSRFGVMFFTGPELAFRNLRGALRPGGRLVFICWRALRENPWMTVPLGVLAQRIALPPPPAPGSPGPFAFADAARVRGILEGAGFSEVALEPVDEPLVIGGRGGPEHAARILLRMGPAAAALREAGTTDVSQLVAPIAQAIAPYATEAGVQLPSASWIVTARSGLAQ